MQVVIPFYRSIISNHLEALDSYEAGESVVIPFYRSIISNVVDNIDKFTKWYFVS